MNNIQQAIELLSQLSIQDLATVNTSLIVNDTENKTILVVNEENTLQSTYNPVELDNCPICLDNIGENNRVNLPCNHSLHLDCYNSFLFTGTGYSNCKKCPMCRTEICNLPVGFGRVIEQMERDREYEADLNRQREEHQLREDNRTLRMINGQLARIRAYRESGDLDINGFENIDLTNRDLREDLIEQGGLNRRTRVAMEMREQSRLNGVRIGDWVCYPIGSVMIRNVRENVRVVDNRIRYRSNNIATIILNHIDSSRVYRHTGELVDYLIAHGVNKRRGLIETGIQRLFDANYLGSSNGIFDGDNNSEHCLFVIVPN